MKTVHNRKRQHWFAGIKGALLITPCLMLFASIPTRVHAMRARNQVKQLHMRVLDGQAAQNLFNAQPTQVTQITIEGSVSPNYTVRREHDRLIVDLSDTETLPSVHAIAERVGVVGGILPQTSSTHVGPVTRFSIAVSQEIAYRVRPDGNTLHIFVSPVSSSKDKQVKAPQVNTLVKINDVRFSQEDSVDRIEIDLSGPVEYATNSKSPGKSRLELNKALLPKELQRVLDTTAYQGSVFSVSTSSDLNRANVVIFEADRAVDATDEVKIESRSNQTTKLVWSFAKAISLRADASSKAPKPSLKESVLSLEQASDESAVGSFLSTTSMQVGRRFSGRKVDLDFVNADIHNILRLLSDVGKVNIVTADDVQGAVTIKMRNVPWDQALDVVLQAKGLGLVRTGNLIRVARAEALDKERELQIAKRKQEFELAPIETRLIRVSYAQASELAKQAAALKTPRGSINVDDRTNMLIVRDVPGSIDQIEELVRTLDTQTPEVLIEARIVEATSRYLRDIGIQWGGDLTFSPATGNPTGLAFPSRIGVAGGASDNQTPTAGLSPLVNQVPNPNFAVNLPATVGTGQGGALGLTFGSINNIVNLSLRLSAAETNGMLRIISSPRVLTLDNRTAKISQGTQIPYSQLSAQGVNTQFQEARLSLEVRPHVTADGSIAMHVHVNRDEPDFNQTSARGDPTILKREADTDLLVQDGATVVIGGIYTRNTGKSVDQVPFFGSIPILGVLFQRRRANDTRSELVIFLTPRIVNRAEALGK